MGVYGKYILPKVIDSVCCMKPIMHQRQKVVPLAKGRVLEIGMGSGLNLAFYDPSKVEFVWGLEPCSQMRAMAEKRAVNLPFDIKFIEQKCEEIPLESNSADTILITYTLCTIPDVMKALEEVRNILKPDGELIFCEHGLAPDKHIRFWQDKINPIWKRIGGGCHLNRPIPYLIEQAGFKIKSMETKYINGWKPASFNYLGTAVKGTKNELR